MANAYSSITLTSSILRSRNEGIFARMTVLINRVWRRAKAKGKVDKSTSMLEKYKTFARICSPRIVTCTYSHFHQVKHSSGTKVTTSILLESPDTCDVHSTRLVLRSILFSLETKSSRFEKTEHNKHRMNNRKQEETRERERDEILSGYSNQFLLANTMMIPSNLFNPIW